MNTELLWLLAKYIALAVIAFVFYLVYSLIVVPFCVWLKYSRYKNVHQSKRFVPLLGDASRIMENEVNDKFLLDFYIQDALKEKRDLTIFYSGYIPFFKPASAQAHREFISMIPDKIERGTMLSRIVSKISPGGLETSKTTKSWEKRNSKLLKIIGVNFASKFIPTIVASLKNTLTSLHEFDEIKFGSQVSTKITFNITGNILFGRGVENAITSIKYIRRDDSETYLEPAKFFSTLMKDLLDAYYTEPHGFMFPILNEYNLGKPFSTNYRNIEEFWKVFKEFLDKNCDNESVYGRLMAEEHADKHQVFIDMMTMMIGGTETTANTYASLLYYLKRNSKCYDKLLEELKDKKLTNPSELTSNELKSQIEECDYLSMGIKEILRIDPPFFDSIDYYAKEDI